MSTRNPDARYETAAQAVPFAIRQWAQTQPEHQLRRFRGTIVSYNANDQAGEACNRCIDVLLVGGSIGGARRRPQRAGAPTIDRRMAHPSPDSTDGDVVLCIVSERSLGGLQAELGRNGTRAALRSVMFQASGRAGDPVGRSRIRRRSRSQGWHHRPESRRALGMLWLHDDGVDVVVGAVTWRMRESGITQVVGGVTVEHTAAGVAITGGRGVSTTASISAFDHRSRRRAMSGGASTTGPS